MASIRIKVDKPVIGSRASWWRNSLFLVTDDEKEAAVALRRLADKLDPPTEE